MSEEIPISFTVWIAKWFLTKGIRKVRVSVVSLKDSNGEEKKHHQISFLSNFKPGYIVSEHDCHRSLQAALNHADLLKASAIRRLEKQLSRVPKIEAELQRINLLSNHPIDNSQTYEY